MKKKTKQKLSDSKNFTQNTKKLNPFEVHINRKKYDILGMKSKSERGLPGISRTKSLNKRKCTLLQEYKMKDKKNTFLDRRIGERNRSMTAEDKILARFAAERMKFHSKKSIYNLGDDEELTHKGQTLTEIEKFDDPKSEDEDEEEVDGKLDSNFVGDAHFGGGIFKKVEGESKSRKDLIDQLIAESIKRKAEKQKLKQQTLDLTQKLDSEWKELLPLVTASKKSKSDAEPANTTKDDKFANYDIMSRKLKFEARGKPSDRLKSEEEIAKEEKERLEKLEKERIQRMMGDMEVKPVKHRSADDLDDGFDLSNEPEEFLTYQDGVLNITEKKHANDLGSNNSNKEQKRKKSCNTEKDDDKEDEKMDVNESENELNDNMSENASDDDDNSVSDNLSDLKDSEDDDGDGDDNDNDIDNDDDETQQKNKGQTENEKTKVFEKEKNKTSEFLISASSDKETEKEAVEKSSALETARNELPYTFDIPKEYEEFEKLMRNYNPDFQAVIVERMIKCHHPSLKEDYKKDLDVLFTFLLQHLQDCATDDTTKVNCFKVLDRLSPWFFDLTQWSPQNSSLSVIEVIKEKYQDFLSTPKIYPSLDTLIFLKLVSILFPTSDYRHPVVTPSLIFMEQMLFQCRVQSSVDLSRGLFIATLVLEYCALSKRFAPEAISFLYGLLRLVHPKKSKISVKPPCDIPVKDSTNLVVLDKSSTIEPVRLSVSDLIQENFSENFKINSIKLTLNLLSRFCDFWDEDQPAILIFKPFIELLDVSQFPIILKNDVKEVLGKILKMKKKLKKLVLEKKKPMPLKLYEPKIEQVYSLKKYQPMSKKKAERAKLIHKYKREMKGALREIRRDRSFIANLKFKETVKSDMERQRKVKEIFGSAAEQAGELNKIKRKKK